MAEAETVDVLELEIKAKAGRTASKLTSLATSVETFGKNIGAYMTTLNSFADVLERVSKAAQGLSGIKNLRSVVSSATKASSAVNEVKKSVAQAQKSAGSGVRSIPGKQFFEMFDRRISGGWRASGKSSSYYGEVFKSILDAEERAMAQARKSAGSGVRSIPGKQFFEMFDSRISGGSKVPGRSDAYYGDVFKSVLDAEEKAAVQARQSAGSGVRSIPGKQFFEMFDNRISGGSKVSGRNAAYYEDVFKSILDAEEAAETLARQNAGRGVQSISGKQFFEMFNQRVIGGGRVSGRSDAYYTDVFKGILDAEEEAAASVKRELDRPQKFSDAEIEQRRKEFAATWSAIEEAANVAEEQKQQASLQRALEDNTPELIAASRSRFASAGSLEAWNELFAPGIPGLADRGMAAGLIDESTAQAMKDAAAGVQEIGEAANDAKESTDALKDSMEEVAEAEQNATTEARSLKDVLKAAGSVIGNSFLGKMSGQIFRVAKMRSLRYIVKEIAAGFKEGTSNLYQWSKGLGGPFAAAMDTIASKAMLAKNSIATAFAPAIQALVPVLNTVVNWINAASNALAQFLALLTGKDSWTAAKESAEDWGDATKGSVGGASKAMKDLLADWDELNIIQSETGGGGGGGSKKKTTDVSDMFEERFKFDEWTRYFDNIKKIVTAIGAGIAAWFVLDTAQEFLKKLGIAGEAVDGIFSRIKKGVAGAVLLVISYELAEVTGKSIARDGLTLENALTGVGSLLSGALGGYFLASAINPALGVVGAIAGLTMALAVGIKAYVDEKRTMLYEDVDKYLAAELSNVFSFDVDAVVERVNTTVENAEQARKAVHDQLADVLTSVEVLKLGVDEESTWAEIHDQVLGKDGNGGLLGKIKTSLGEDRNVITLYYETKSREGLEGKNGTTVANGMKTELMANSWLAGEYTRLGKKFGECFNEGEVASIKEGKADAAQAILSTITEAEQAAERARASAELNVELKNKMAGLDDDVVMEEMSSIFDEYEQKLAAARKKIAEEHYITLASSLAELKSLGADDALIQSVQTMLDEAQKELDKTDLDWKVDVHAEFADDEKKMFGKELVKRYGPELAQLVSSLSGEYLSDLGFLSEVLNKGGYDQFAQSLIKDFMMGLPPEAKKWMQDNGVDVTDFFTDEQKKKILEGRNRIAPDEVEEVVEEIADPLETANKWWDEYRSLMEKQEQNGGLPASEWKTENELFGDVKMVLGDNFDAFWTSLQEYINGLEDPWSEEDLPSEVVPGGTEAGATAFYTGTPDETFEMDAGGSGLATDDAVNGAAADVTSGMAKLENVMGLVKTAVDLVAEYTRMTANKDFTVTINPSAAFGRVGNTSGRMFGNVTGD